MASADFGVKVSSACGTWRRWVWSPRRQPR